MDQYLAHEMVRAILQFAHSVAIYVVAAPALIGLVFWFGSRS